jgi:hypothetical protein
MPAGMVLSMTGTTTTFARRDSSRRPGRRVEVARPRAARWRGRAEGSAGFLWLQDHAGADSAAAFQAIRASVLKRSSSSAVQGVVDRERSLSHAPEPSAARPIVKVGSRLGRLRASSGEAEDCPTMRVSMSRRRAREPTR